MRLYSIPQRDDLLELARPWKLLSFAVAMTLLLYGALNYAIADWDVGITLIMGTLTYLFAPLAIRAMQFAIRTPSKHGLIDVLLALVIAWFVIDGVYVAYHTLVGNTMYREDNFHASTPIYFMAGMFWLYRGSVRELVANLRSLLSGFR